LTLTHLLFNLAHSGASLIILLHLFNLDLPLRLLILLNFLLQLLLALRLVKLFANLGLFLPPILQVLYFLELFCAAILVDLVLDSVLGELLLDPLLLVDLEALLAQTELLLLLFELFAQDLLSFLGLHFLVFRLLVLLEEREFIQSGPFIVLVVKAAHRAHVIFVGVHLHYPEVIPKSLPEQSSRANHGLGNATLRNLAHCLLRDLRLARLSLSHALFVILVLLLNLLQARLLIVFSLFSLHVDLMRL